MTGPEPAVIASHNGRATEFEGEGDIAKQTKIFNTDLVNMHLRSEGSGFEYTKDASSPTERWPGTD